MTDPTAGTCPECSEITHDADCPRIGDGRPYFDAAGEVVTDGRTFGWKSSGFDDSGWPDPAAEEVRVLRIEEGDRLAIVLDSPLTDGDDAEVLLDALAEWSGLDRDRIVLLVGADLTVLRSTETATGRDPDAAP